MRDIYHFGQILCVLYCLFQCEMHPAAGWYLGVDPCRALCPAFCLKTGGVLASCLCSVWQDAKLPFLCLLIVHRHAHLFCHALYFQLAVCLLVHSVCESCWVDHFAAPCCDDVCSCLYVVLLLLRH